MYNITLISTRHDNIGECNSDALYQILETIQPEVIFEELPYSYFDIYYKEKSRANLETDAINAYLQIRNINHIPVDCDHVPSETFFQDHKNAMDRVLGLKDENGFHFRNSVDRNKRYAAIYGFKYLNSEYCVQYSDLIYDAIEKGLAAINDDKLTSAYRLWNENNSRREDVMLQNIYNYSKEHPYNKAVFLLGAGHRKSIINKIRNYENDSVPTTLNWWFYGREDN